MIIELQSKLSDSNSLWVIVQVKGPFQQNAYEIWRDFENGWGPAHEGARFEGDDPPEMTSWLRH